MLEFILICFFPFLGNVVQGAHVTAYARIEMYKCLMSAQRAGCHIYYTDTDSYLMSMKKCQSLPLSIGYAYGEFKYEIDDEIVTFYSLGPKNYCIVTRDKNGHIQQTVKARGFYLKNAWSSHEVNDQTFKDHLKKYLLDETSSKVIVPQFHIRCEKKTKKIFSELSMKVFANDTYNKRVSFKGARANSFTLPFGYSEEMLGNALERTKLNIRLFTSMSTITDT